MNSAAKEIDPYFALADPTRRKILALISNHECSVNSLVEQFEEYWDTKMDVLNEYLQTS